MKRQHDHSTACKAKHLTGLPYSSDVQTVTVTLESRVPCRQTWWLRILQQDPKAAGESHWAWLGLLTAQSPSDTLLPTKPYLLISSIDHSTVTNIQIDGSHSYSKNLTVHPSHAGLELAVSLQLQPPMFWVYSCALLCPTRNGIPPCIT